MLGGGTSSATCSTVLNKSVPAGKSVSFGSSLSCRSTLEFRLAVLFASKAICQCSVARQHGGSVLPVFGRFEILGTLLGLWYSSLSLDPAPWNICCCPSWAHLVWNSVGLILWVAISPRYFCGSHIGVSSSRWRFGIELHFWILDANFDSRRQNSIISGTTSNQEMSRWWKSFFSSGPTKLTATFPL
jgi:hypothetical protein